MAWDPESVQLLGSSMKANPTNKKLTVWSGSSLVVKLLFLIVVLPLSIPVVGWFVEALVWRQLLCNIKGIDLMGGLLEAFALSAAMGGFIACANLLVAVIIDGVKKLRKLPLEKLGQRKAAEATSWGDLYKALPGFRALLQHFFLNTMALTVLTSFQPLRLHFDGAFELLLAAGVLTASWIFFMTVLSVAAFTFLLKRSKAEVAAGKAAV